MNQAKIKTYVCLLNTLMVRLEKEQEKSSGGIILPKVGGKQPREKIWGEVIQTGPGVWTETAQQLPCVCKPGDRVALYADAGTDLDLEGGTFRILSEHDVILVEGR